MGFNARSIVPTVSVDLITRSVERAAHRIPAATCLTQAFAAQILLSRAGHDCDIRIGVLNTDKKLRAHAWVECEGRVVIGDVRGIEEFAVLPAL